jgi:branched-chain amino acid transport system substrate-binding protein
VITATHNDEGPQKGGLRRLLVGLARVELATSRLSGVRSNHLSYRPSAQLPYQTTAPMQGRNGRRRHGVIRSIPSSRQNLYTAPMSRFRALSVFVAVAIAAACATPGAARSGEPSTRVVVEGGIERRAEDVATELVAQADGDVGRDDASAKRAYRRVVDEFADTRSRGQATVSLARLLLAENTPASTTEAQRWLERFLLADPAHPAAAEARQLHDGGLDKTGSALASLDVPPSSPAGRGSDRVVALLSALPRLSGKERTAAEDGLVTALDVPLAQGGVAFDEVVKLRARYGVADAFADEVLLWKLARIRAHLGDDQAASAFATELNQRHPKGRFAALATQMVARLQSRVQVDPKVLGVLLPLTGEYAAYGKRALVAIRLAFNLPVGADADEEVSEVDPETGETVVKKVKPKVLAGTLEVPGGLTLVIKDSAGRADVAVAAVRELVEKHHVIAILGDILVDTSLPVALACEDYGVPMVSLARRDGVPEAGPFSFRLALTPKKQARALATYAVDGMHYKRFAIMHPKHAFGIELMGHFWDALDEMQAEVTAVEAYAHDQTTFTTEAKSLVGRGMVAGTTKEVVECREQARGIDNEYRRRKALEGCNDKAKPIIDFEALFIPDSYKAISFVIPALIAEDVLLTNQKWAVDAYKKATGNEKVRPVQLLGPSTMNDPDLAARLGRTVDGAVFVDGFDPLDETPLVQGFLEGFQRGTRSRPTLIEAQTYDAARLLGSLLEGQLAATGNQRPKTRAAVRDGLDAVDGFVGVTGTIGFDAEGDSVTPLHFFKLEREKIERFDLKDALKPEG